MKRAIVYISVIFISLSFSFSALKSDIESQNYKPYVVILSMDGFRWDYPEKAKTPNLDYIEQIGVRAEASIPCFPTKTFPNHYSMATGLYPDNHGIVQNSFYAPDIKKSYSISNREAVRNPDFYFGEPIWVTAEKQGVKSASYFWVGSEAPHDSIFPTYHYDYDGSVPFEERIEGVINWLNLPDSIRPHLIMWYLQEPDGIGHDLGPNHPEMINMVEYLDSLVGVFYYKINELAIAENINIIITSDHGMGEISEYRVVYLDSLVPKHWCKHIDGANPVYSIEAKEEYYDTIFNILSNTEHLTFWEKDNVPERLHYGKSNRVKDFVLVADSSWSLLKSSTKRAYSGGTHGYDNKNKDMHAIFYASGPAFKKAYKSKAINNIDIYPLICRILNLKPIIVDGKIESTEDMLK
ncbi:MAG: ectonucleotide pyrophosphatase/phosphodiesterase [Bacteroidales bacterium]|jgi:predicted AlkP superfamily pyrophosphatase or phosphodiesterase|nr:ectonucleotide pyrophosphatase/phosphodiesterase [Bacteroidales bacterium]